jgi:hypothetical protein
MRPRSAGHAGLRHAALIAGLDLDLAVGDAEISSDDVVVDLPPHRRSGRRNTLSRSLRVTIPASPPRASTTGRCLTSRRAISRMASMMEVPRER